MQINKSKRSIPQFPGKWCSKNPYRQFQPYQQEGQNDEYDIQVSPAGVFMLS